MTGVATAIITAGVLAAGAQTYAAISGAKSQKKAGQRQDAAQKASLLAAQRDQKLAQQAERKANRRKPDVSSLLFAERQRANMGAGSTTLSRPGGSPLLGSKSSLLGGGY